MRIEIKKISIVSLLVSALPVVVFIIMLINSLSAIFVPSQQPFLNVLVQAVFLAIAKTLITMVCVVIGSFVYNFLCAVGLKGVKLDLEDVK